MVIQMELDIVRLKMEKPHWKLSQLADHFGVTTSYISEVISKGQINRKVLQVYNSLLDKVTATGKLQFQVTGHTLRAIEWELLILHMRERIELRKIGNHDTGYYYKLKIL